MASVLMRVPLNTPVKFLTNMHNRHLDHLFPPVSSENHKLVPLLLPCS